MFGQSEERPRARYDLNSIPTKAEPEAEIVQAARTYEEARRALHQLQAECNKLNQAMAEAEAHMQEAGRRIMQILG